MKNTNETIGKMNVTVTPNTDNTNAKKHKVTFTNLTKDQKETLLSVGIGAAIVASATGVTLYAVGNDGEDYKDELALELEAELAAENTTEETTEAENVEEGTEAVETIEEMNLEVVTEEAVDDYGNASEVVTIYTDAPWAYLPEDTMDFSEAFAMARADVGGGGGFFVWNGEMYNTYNAEEWEAMTAGEREQYYTSIEHMTDVSNIPTAEYASVDYTVADQEYIIGEDDIISSIDYSNDGINDGYIVDADNNGYYDVVLDLDGNGKIDELILDLENIHDGNVNAIQVNALPTDFEVETSDFQYKTVDANTLTITEEDVIESANITGNDSIEAVLVNTDGDDIADIAFDSDADGSLDVVVVDLGTPTQEIVEIDAVSITDKMVNVEVDDNQGLDDFEIDEEFVEEDVDGFELDTDSLDVDMDDIDYSELS